MTRQDRIFKYFNAKVEALGVGRDWNMLHGAER